MLENLHLLETERDRGERKVSLGATVPDAVESCWQQLPAVLAGFWVWSSSLGHLGLGSGGFA